MSFTRKRGFGARVNNPRKFVIPTSVDAHTLDRIQRACHALRVTPSSLLYKGVQEILDRLERDRNGGHRFPAVPTGDPLEAPAAESEDAGVV